MKPADKKPWRINVVKEVTTYLDQKVTFLDYVSALVTVSPFFNKNIVNAKLGHSTVMAVKDLPPDATHVYVDRIVLNALLEALNAPRSPWRDGFLPSVTPFTDSLTSATMSTEVE